MSDKSSEQSEMSDAALAAQLLRGVVTVDAGATIKERIVKTSRALGWVYSRTRDVWYEQARRIDAHEMDALRAAVRQRELEEAKREYRELDARLARLEAAVALANPTLDREALDLLQQEIRGPGGVDRAGAQQRGLSGEPDEPDG